MVEIYLACLILGAFLSIIVLYFDEVLSFAEPLDFSLVVTFITIVGGSGLILSEFAFFPLEWVFTVSIFIGVLFTGTFYFIYLKPMRESENSVAFSIQDLVGTLGEMLTSVQGNAYGEVLIRFGASYTSQIAASTSGDMIVKGAQVRIDLVKEGILYVSLVSEKM